jgi:Protein of unknown function (DUF2878)
MARRLAACFVVGSVVGTLLDAIHAYGDVLTYPDPVLGRLAFFVPLEFGLLGLLAGTLVPALERAAGETPAFATLERLRELTLFAALYASSALLGDGWSVPLAVALAALAVVRLARSPGRGDRLYVVLAAVLGPAAEALMSALGAFEYRHPDVAGVPLWLPALWANGGFLIRRLIGPIAMPSGPAAEQARVVGDHARDAKLAEHLDPAAVVDGPDV